MKMMPPRTPMTLIKTPLGLPVRKPPRNKRPPIRELSPREEEEVVEGEVEAAEAERRLVNNPLDNRQLPRRILFLTMMMKTTMTITKPLLRHQCVKL